MIRTRLTIRESGNILHFLNRFGFIGYVDTLKISNTIYNGLQKVFAH